MAGKPYKRYSVYERGTDRPICIYGTAEECAAALGVPLQTFYTYVARQRHGHKERRKKIEIFFDDFDDEEEPDS